jgi:hypothetical protein
MCGGLSTALGFVGRRYVDRSVFTRQGKAYGIADRQGVHLRRLFRRDARAGFPFVLLRQVNDALLMGNTLFIRF